MALLEIENLTVEFPTRRKTFVAMISRRYRTMDQFMAFSKSVNMIINNRNLNQIGGILGRGLTERDLFYRVFNDSLRAVGRPISDKPLSGFIALADKVLDSLSHLFWLD